MHWGRRHINESDFIEKIPVADPRFASAAARCQDSVVAATAASSPAMSAEILREFEHLVM